jgi:glycosyltransferase involved in cell wall biosynthesis
VARTAQEAERRFGTQTRTLEPLYSLADFCYLVRREVIATIGAADEGYGLGPCWEMDYNIRAARAGFRGVWACAAFVHRAPFTARRRREEARRFEASKHRYQDKVCALRLRGTKPTYEPHCRGDACEHFAPSGMLQFALPLPAAAPLAEASSPRPPVEPRSELSPGQAPAGRLPAPGGGSISVREDTLVSCIMPTYNRRGFVPQAVRCFLSQDYTTTELLIVDDGTDPIRDCLPDDPRIRYAHLDHKLTIGAKRNLACGQARGTVIVHWDDDDWYPPWRVRAQLRALLDHPADLCGSSTLFYYEIATDRSWRYAYAGRGAPWLAGNTLAYRKSLWDRGHFADLQVGEDTRFVWNAAARSVFDLADPALCVGMIHPGNTSPKITGGSYWRPQPGAAIHELLGGDLLSYRTRPSRESADAATPLVSCIMPTYNRRAFVALALRGFLSQEYPNKELLIVDDGTDPVRDLVEGMPSVHYLRLTRRGSIGGKRNLACREARGEIIAHWDDDDWYGPERLRYQAAPILSGDADLSGLENSYMLDICSGQFWAMSRELHRRMFEGDIHGGTLMYRRAFLEQGLRYPEVNLAEDALLIRRALAGGKRLARLDNPALFIYMRHRKNAWRFEPGHFLEEAGWQRIAPPTSFPPATLDAYRAAVTTR